MTRKAPAAATSVALRRNWPRRTALAVVLVIAFILRVAFGWPAPNPGRAVDERYTLENVDALLRSRTFAPVSAFHPSLSYLPQTLFLALVDSCACVELDTGTFEILRPHPGWYPGWEPTEQAGTGIRPVPFVTSLAFRSCRLFQALLGTLTVALVYGIGRRYGSTAVGLGAALGVAGAPFLIWSSGICNEDAGMVLAFTVVIAATCACCRDPSWRRFALVGLACGVALSSKFNAGPAALPIAGWVLARPRRWRREVPRLALAGLVALGTFLGLNPHFVTRTDMLRHDFGHTVRNYGEKSRKQKNGRLGVAWSGLVSPMEAENLGPIAGAAALAGALLLLARRRRNSETSPLQIAVLGFPAAYVGLYALATGNISPHNWMPIVPSAALGAGALLDGARRLPSTKGWLRVGRPAALIVVSSAIASTMVNGVLLVYRCVVPTTASLAENRIDNLCRSRCRIGVEIADDRTFVTIRPRPVRALWIEPADGRRFSPEELSVLDGWIVADLNDSSARTRAERELVRGARVERVRARALEARGPDLRIVYRPWREQSSRTEDILERGPGGIWRFERPPIAEAPGSAVTLVLSPVARWKSNDCWLRVGGRARSELRDISPLGRSDELHLERRLSSERLSIDASTRIELVCHGKKGLKHDFRKTVEIVSWAPPTPLPTPSSRR
jgi:Dolichyl-phosphate-mannose-protein mannosyltransferase